MSEKISYQCACGQKLNIKASLIGQDLDCPACGVSFEVPSSDIDDFISQFVEEKEPATEGERSYSNADRRAFKEGKPEQRRDAVRAAMSNLGLAVVVILILIGISDVAVVMWISNNDEVRVASVILLVSSIPGLVLMLCALSLVRRCTVLLCDIHQALTN